MTAADLPGPEAVLAFWFGCDGDPDFGRPRSFWFRAGAEADRQVSERFGALLATALRGGCDDWLAAPEPCLALVLVLDQFPRHVFRGEARAYAGDAQALAAARHALERGWDRALGPAQRQFLYLPLMHSERIADQRRCVALMAELEREGWRHGALRAAREHLRLIERFGRFPHRNAALGRASTPQEAAWLARSRRSFGQRKAAETAEENR